MSFNELYRAPFGGAAIVLEHGSMVGFPSAASMVAALLVSVSSEFGGAQDDPATCWQRLRVLQAVLDARSAIAPGHVITRTHREREKAIRLCRSGDYEAGIEIIEKGIDKLMEHEARDGRSLPRVSA